MKKKRPLPTTKTVETSYGLSQLPTIDLLDLCPDFDEVVFPHSGSLGGSPILDIAVLKALARKFQDCRYLEIGSFRGESLANLATCCSHCWSVTLGREEMLRRQYPTDFIQGHGQFSKGCPNVTQVYADSTTFDFGNLKTTFDLIFVDGDHHPNAVASDSSKVIQILRSSESVVVWHDYGINVEEVRPSVLAGILRGVPKTLHKHLYHISNTYCAIFTRKQFKTTKTTKFQPVNKIFEIKIKGHRL